MDKKAVCMILVSLILISLSWTSFQVVEADSDRSNPFSDGFTLLSPVNTTYNSKMLTLNYTFVCGWCPYSINYSVDGVYNGSIPYTITNPQETHVVYQSTGLVQLPELSEGSHSLTVSLEADFNDH